MKKYKIFLTKKQRIKLSDIITKGIHTPQQYRTAYILLNCDEGKYGSPITGRKISSLLKVSLRMIDRVKQRYFTLGFNACLDRKPVLNRKKKEPDNVLRIHVLALYHSDPPAGFEKWSLRLLAARMIKQKFIKQISYETIRKILLQEKGTTQ